MAQYTVREGESLLDVCYNACGSLSALSVIMELNKFTTMTPILETGQVLEVPQTYNNGVVIVADDRPFNSTAISDEYLNKLLEEVADTTYEPYLVRLNNEAVSYVVTNGAFMVKKKFAK